MTLKKHTLYESHQRKPYVTRYDCPFDANTGNEEPTTYGGFKLNGLTSESRMYRTAKTMDTGYRVCVTKWSDGAVHIKAICGDGRLDSFKLYEESWISDTPWDEIEEMVIVKALRHFPVLEAPLELRSLKGSKYDR